MTDANTVKLIEADALPHYVKLLNPELDESVQSAAAHGLWLLSFQCKDEIMKQPGCYDGQLLTIVKPFVIRSRDSLVVSVLD